MQKEKQQRRRERERKLLTNNNNKDNWIQGENLLESAWPTYMPLQNHFPINKQTSFLCHVGLGCEFFVSWLVGCLARETWPSLLYLSISSISCSCHLVDLNKEQTQRSTYTWPLAVFVWTRKPFFKTYTLYIKSVRYFDNNQDREKKNPMRRPSSELQMKIPSKFLCDYTWPLIIRLNNICSGGDSSRLATPLFSENCNFQHTHTAYSERHREREKVPSQKNAYICCISFWNAYKFSLEMYIVQ